MNQSQLIETYAPMEEEQIMSESNDEYESKKSRKEKKPCKTTRKQRTQKYIMKIQNDSLEQVVGDILDENKRLRRDIETLRIQNTSLRREHEELIHALLADRLRIQNPELEF